MIVDFTTPARIAMAFLILELETRGNRSGGDQKNVRFKLHFAVF